MKKKLLIQLIQNKVFRSSYTISHEVIKRIKLIDNESKRATTHLVYIILDKNTYLKYFHICVNSPILRNRIMMYSDKKKVY